MFYVFVFIWELWEVYHCDWFPQTNNLWKGWPNMPPLHFSLEALYVFQLGFYWHTLYAHFTMEVKRDDWWPLLAHHVVTIWLIYFSYMIGFARGGLLVLITHDTNDVFLEIGKTFVYREKKTATNITFVIMVLSWVVTRLCIYPGYVIWSTFVELPNHIPNEVAYECWLNEFKFCLCFLLVLHVYWFFLMLRIIYKIATGQDRSIRDTREHKNKKAEVNDVSEPTPVQMGS